MQELSFSPHSIISLQAGATETDDEDSNQGNIIEIGDFLSTEFLPENYDAGLDEDDNVTLF